MVQDLIKQGNDVFNTMKDIPNPGERSALTVRSHTTANPGLKLRCEVSHDLGNPSPRLRLIVDEDIDVDTTVSKTDPTSPMNHLSTQLTTEHSELKAELEDLSKSVSNSTPPVSRIDAGYKRFSANDDPATTSIPSTKMKATHRPKLDPRSDSYLRRQLLGLYVDAEIFDGVSKRNNGERSMEDAEVLMAKFLERVERDGILRGKSEKAYLGAGRLLRFNKIILDLRRMRSSSST